MSGTVATARVEAGSIRGTSKLAWLAARIGGRRNDCEPINLFLVLGRHPKLFRGWLRFAGSMMPGGRLPRVDTELVILRVAHLTGCEYERRHHEHIARSVGLDGADIDNTAREVADWPPRRAALIEATDQLVLDGDLDDAARAHVREYLDEREAIELVLLATHYRMLAATIAALRVPLERPRA